MTIDNIRQLEKDNIREAIEANLTFDPAKIALSKHIEAPALVASQVKYLQRSRTKLPSYYATRAIIPSLAYEQSSSEAVASVKHYSGKLCIDLTCGLGVDSGHFAQSFERVIAVERDPVLALVAKINFKRLGIDNVEVINWSAEEFLASFAGIADLIYADPDRRNSAGKRLTNPAYCSPNVVELMPKLLNISKLVVIKNSPLFDVDELFKTFGSACQKVEVVSSNGECKEILAECSATPYTPIIRATSCELGSYEQPYSTTHKTINFQLSTFNYIVVPDVALRVAHLVTDYFECATPNGYAFCNEIPENLLGKAYPITAIMPYNPKQIKRMLAELDIQKANIHLSDINLTNTQILGQLGIKEGGAVHLFFTTLVEKRWCIVSKL